MDLLSGDQNGLLPSSDPASGCHSSASSGRDQMLRVPFDVATAATMRPSGDNVTSPTVVASGGGRISKRTTPRAASVGAGADHGHSHWPTVVSSSAAATPGHAYSRVRGRARCSAVVRALDGATRLACSARTKRAVEMSATRSRCFFSRQRRKSVRTAAGVSRGRAFQSGSFVMRKASVSVTSSPWNARRPVSIS